MNLADDAWHMVAFSFESGVANGTKIYIDGQEVLTTTITINRQDAVCFTSVLAVPMVV